MKKIFLILCLAFSFQSALAHELLPEEAVEFMKNNPQATVEELDAYMESLDDHHEDHHHHHFSPAMVIAAGIVLLALTVVLFKRKGLLK